MTYYVHYQACLQYLNGQLWQMVLCLSASIVLAGWLAGRNNR